jgi:hypothetical protein
VLIEVEPGGLSGAAPTIGSLANSLQSSVPTVSLACESAAGAAGHAAVQAACRELPVDRRAGFVQPVGARAGDFEPPWAGRRQLRE